MALLAAQRDATWHSRPSTTGAKRWHVVSADGVTPACRAQMVLQDDMAIEASEVMESRRCQRPGCKQLWPVVEANTEVRQVHSGEKGNLRNDYEK